MLFTHGLKIPIFFSFENKENLELYGKLKDIANGKGKTDKKWVPGHFQFVVTATDPIKVDQMEV